MIPTFLRPNDSQKRAEGQRASDNNTNEGIGFTNNPKLVKATECKIGGIYKLHIGKIVNTTPNYYDNIYLKFIGIYENDFHKYKFAEINSTHTHSCMHNTIFQVISESN